MKTELEKMRQGELAITTDPTIMDSILRAHRLVKQMNDEGFESPRYRELLCELIPDFPNSAKLIPPFLCDHGHGICVGENVFINANCTFLDGAFITIGARTLIGPNVQIYTPHHPMNYMERRLPQEYAFPVIIGEDCWIGGGAIICPGVAIGNRCVVGAGSVVTRDVPDDTMVGGNPAVVKKKLI